MDETEEYISKMLGIATRMNEKSRGKVSGNSTSRWGVTERGSYPFIKVLGSCSLDFPVGLWIGQFKDNTYKGRTLFIRQGFDH
jgi:hypothetical protein